MREGWRDSYGTMCGPKHRRKSVISQKSRGAASDRKTERGATRAFGNRSEGTGRIETALPFQTDRLSKHRVGCMVGRHRAKW